MSAGVCITAYIVNRISDRVHPQKIQQAESSPSAFSQSQTAPASVSSSVQFPDFTPTIKGVPESAPAYAQLIQVKQAPILAGCVLNRQKNECKCFTKQATPYPATKEYCNTVVSGDRFNPYLNDTPPPVQVNNEDSAQTSSAL